MKYIFILVSVILLSIAASASKMVSVTSINSVKQTSLSTVQLSSTSLKALESHSNVFKSWWVWLAGIVIAAVGAILLEPALVIVGLSLVVLSELLPDDHPNPNN